MIIIIIFDHLTTFYTLICQHYYFIQLKKKMLRMYMYTLKLSLNLSILLFYIILNWKQ